MELILNTFGVSLNRDNEAFIITKKGERHRIPVDDVKSILKFTDGKENDIALS